ncbi:MAG: hypothetical protein ACI361_05490 [Atopobiaceae bacterium]
MESKTSGAARPGRVRYGHPSMSAAERAKIFMPFDALPEYRGLLKKKEEEIRDRQKRGLI